MKSLRPGEAPALALSFLYFLLLLASYYLLRPVRDSLVAGLGVDEIKYLVLAVFLVMLAVTPLFGALMRRIPRRKLLPALYAFFAANLLLFAAAFAAQNLGPWPARVFYVWLMVFNMFVVSVFWSFMADIWQEEQGRRLFGFIAGGGSIGGLLGPSLAQTLAERIGISGLTLLAAVLLSGTVVCLFLLGRVTEIRMDSNDKQTQTTRTFAGSSWQGMTLLLRSSFLLGIAMIVIVGAIVAQLAYAETARLAKDLIATTEARTIFFAHLDLWTNIAALILQAMIVGPLTARLGIVAPLVGLAVVGVIAFGALALSPILFTLSASNIARRAAEFGLGKPGRDMLYTVTTPQEKYLAKNVIDTVIYRSGDFIGGWLYGALSIFGVTLAGFGWLSAAAMTATIGVALAVARAYRRRGGR